MISAGEKHEHRWEGRDRAFPPQWVRTALAIVGWFVLNISIASVNKWVISVDHFELPATLTAVHMACSYVMSALCLRTCLPANARLDPSPETLANVRKLSLAFCLSVFCGNMALQYVYVSFSQMVGAASPLVTLLLSKCITDKQYAPLAYASMVPMCGGVMMCVRGELDWSVMGLLLLVASSMLRGVKSIMQGSLLTSHDETEKLDPLSLLKLMSKWSILLLGVYALVTGELGEIISVPELRQIHVLARVFLSGIIAFALNVCNFLVTKYTSAVTLQVLGNIKVILSIAISLLIFHNPLSTTSAAGCALTLAGVALYQRGTTSESPNKC